ncbi:potassium-transporting ATPase subunit KdpC [Magnetospirillum molischianum]|uniref:Potassium-transporting ATPase KdpC subunit n=1 Tax=Magnetospirillum molischianum DSM 120 TaxID=1150626 RepID=H8FVL4_MAGML|nr:potassium-transporting ATPase subunit KdpC [Magnetospirillum molischianum]CCG42402.1 P-type ATPase, high-affinity potassium transport system, C chain [Magnetospirillum molischianum DSM 120]
MLKELRPALVMVAAMTVLTGLAYPLTVTGLAQIAFPWQAKGSLIESGGQVVGSALIGQSFTGPAYVWGRPSATVATDPADPTKTVSAPYNAASSGGSNLAPSSQALIDGVTQAVATIRAAHPDQTGPVPVDLVTASSSGLDPDISPAAALWQAGRIAQVRHAPVEDVKALMIRHIEGRLLGILGEPRVNVLRLNLALDERWPMK